MIHYFEKKGEYTFVMLHGTGGTEQSLRPIADDLNINYSKLGIRGEETKTGYNRYFNRLDNGDYDIENINNNSDKLRDEILHLCKKYSIDIEKIVILGYSNGANITINMMLRNQNLFKTYILLHPMYPIYHEISSLENINIFISVGLNDHLVPVKNSFELIDRFKNLNAKVEVEYTDNHQISFKEIEKAKNWLNKINA